MKKIVEVNDKDHEVRHLIKSEEKKQLTLINKKEEAAIRRTKKLFFLDKIDLKCYKKITKKIHDLYKKRIKKIYNQKTELNSKIKGVKKRRKNNPGDFVGKNCSSLRSIDEILEKGNFRRTDLEAIFFVEHRVFSDPFLSVLVKEVALISEKTIRGSWGDGALNIFEEWLSSSISEVCEGNGLDYLDGVKLVRAMVIKTRIMAGSKVAFPFEDEEDSVIKARNFAQSKRKSQGYKKSSNSALVDSENTIFLSEEEREKYSSELQKIIFEKYGFKVSITTCDNAKKRGWLMKPGSNKKIQGEIILLDPEDKNSDWKIIFEKYGISRSSAFKAMKTGYILVNSKNRGSVYKKIGDTCCLCGQKIAVLEEAVLNNGGGSWEWRTVGLAHKECR
ncbi:MAG: hypothetical protein V1698_01160 [bacterium]